MLQPVQNGFTLLPGLNISGNKDWNDSFIYIIQPVKIPLIMETDTYM